MTPNSEASGLTDDELLAAMRKTMHGADLAGLLMGNAPDAATIGQFQRGLLGAMRAAIDAHEAKRPSTSAEAVAYKFVNANSAAGWAVLVLDQVAWDKLGHGAKLYTHPVPSTTVAAGEAWQPIETAPDEAFFHAIVAAPVDSSGLYVEEAWWDHDRREWWPANTDYTDAHGSAVYPTHWMPLPAPPGTAPPTDPKADPDLLRRMAEVLERVLVQNEHDMVLTGDEIRAARADIDQLLKEARQ